jgi:hypothetical protein
MAVKTLLALAALAAGGFAPLTPASAAGSDTPGTRARAAPASEVSAQNKRRARLRIEITPGRPLYRQCSAWYVIEYRFSGPTMVPRMRCWWVRG